LHILGIETATKPGSIAILEDGKVAAECILAEGQTHSQTLLQGIERLLRQLNLRVSDLDLIAASQGPGGFTGLRIGLAIAQGLGFSLNKPLVGISTLEALAYNIAPTEQIIYPMLDARQGQVYTAAFAWRGEVLERLTPDGLQYPATLAANIQKPCIFLGDCLGLYTQVLKQALGDLAAFATLEHCLPQARWVAILGQRTFNEGDVLAPHELLPHYVRRSQAEEKRKIPSLGGRG